MKKLSELSLADLIALATMFDKESSRWLAIQKAILAKMTKINFES